MFRLKKAAQYMVGIVHELKMADLQVVMETNKGRI
jgi:hypothetical protein